LVTIRIKSAGTRTDRPPPMKESPRATSSI
jgi:hypothetical protein